VNICDILQSIKGVVDIFEGMNDNDKIYLVNYLKYYSINFTIF